MKDQLSTNLRLSVQRALLGQVTGNLYAVTCGINTRTILLVAYFSGPVCDEDIERIRCVGTEIIADFPEGYSIQESCHSLQEEALRVLDFWALLRAEVSEARTSNS
jgi:hypothetical protein